MGFIKVTVTVRHFLDDSFDDFHDDLQDDLFDNSDYNLDDDLFDNSDDNLDDDLFDYSDDNLDDDLFDCLLAIVDNIPSRSHVEVSLDVVAIILHFRPQCIMMFDQISI